MASSPILSAPARPPGRSRANIELTVFGFLVSLAVKAALDTAYGKTIPVQATSVQDLDNALLVPATLQIGIFLITVVRFIYGAYRFQEEGPGELPRGALVWNLVGTLVLFALFYITGLAILDADTFYRAMIYVHVWDLLWFAILFTAFRGSKGITKKVIISFIILDLLTVVWLLFIQAHWHSHFMGKAEISMIVFAVLDFAWNHEFFFSPDAWRDKQLKRL